MADSSPEEVHVPAEVATGAAAPDVTDLTEQKERDEIVIRPAKQRTSRGSRRGAVMRSLGQNLRGQAPAHDRRRRLRQNH